MTYAGPLSVELILNVEEAVVHRGEIVILLVRVDQDLRRTVLKLLVLDDDAAFQLVR